MRILVFSNLTDRFSVCHLRLADVRFDAKFALHPVDDDFKVQLAHAGKNRLAGVDIGIHPQCRVFLRTSFAIAIPNFSWSAFGFRLDSRSWMTGSGKSIDSSRIRVLLVADRLTGLDRP